MAGQGRRSVIGRLHYRATEQIADRDTLAGLQGQTGLAHGSGLGGDRYYVVERQALRGQNSGHELGQRGGVQTLLRVEGSQRLSTLDIHQQHCRAPDLGRPGQAGRLGARLVELRSRSTAYPWCRGLGALRRRGRLRQGQSGPAKDAQSGD